MILIMLMNMFVSTSTTTCFNFADQVGYKYLTSKLVVASPQAFSIYLDVLLDPTMLPFLMWRYLRVNMRTMMQQSQLLGLAISYWMRCIYSTALAGQLFWRGEHLVLQGIVGFTITLLETMLEPYWSKNKHVSLSVNRFSLKILLIMVVQ